MINEIPKVSAKFIYLEMVILYMITRNMMINIRAMVIVTFLFTYVSSAFLTTDMSK